MRARSSESERAAARGEFSRPPRGPGSAQTEMRAGQQRKNKPKRSVFGDADVEAEKALARALKMAGIDRASNKSVRPKRPQTPQIVQEETERAWSNAKAESGEVSSSEQASTEALSPKGMRSLGGSETQGAPEPNSSNRKIGLKARLLDELQLGRELTQQEQEEEEEDKKKESRRPDPIHTLRLEADQEEEPSPWDYDNCDDEDQICSDAFLLDRHEDCRGDVKSDVDDLPQFATQQLNGKLMMKTKRQQHRKSSGVGMA